MYRNIILFDKAQESESTEKICVQKKLEIVISFKPHKIIIPRTKNTRPFIIGLKTTSKIFINKILDV